MGFNSKNYTPPESDLTSGIFSVLVNGMAKPKRRTTQVIGVETTSEPRESATEKEQPPTDAMPAAPPAGRPVPERGDGDGTQRLSFKITNGKLDTSSLRASTAEVAREVFKASLSDPEFQSFVGVGGSAAPAGAGPGFSPPRLEFPPQVFAKLLDGVSLAQAIIYAKKYRVTPQEVAPLVAWSEEEHEILDETGAKAITEVIPPSWLQYSNAEVFLLSITALLAAKAKAVDAAFASRVDSPNQPARPSNPPPSPGTRVTETSRKVTEVKEPPPDPKSAEAPASGASKVPPMPMDNEKHVTGARSLEK